jgi:hypothetical protein
VRFIVQRKEKEKTGGSLLRALTTQKKGRLFLQPALAKQKLSSRFGDDDCGDSSKNRWIF